MKIFKNTLSSSEIIKTIVVVVVVAGFLFACKKGGDSTNTVECSGPAKSFSADIIPIIQSSCAMDADCHGSNSISGPGSLLNYQQVFNARLAIRSAVLSGEMPKDASLTTSEKNAIICWINNGAANN